MIRTHSLTKFYGRRCAVRDLSVEIEDREIVGFLGLNGAGKTTTLKMLAGLLMPSSGTIHIDGQDMLSGSAEAFRWRIGFLPERPPVYEDMTVENYLGFAARLRGVDEPTVERRVGEVIEMCDLSEYRDEVIQSLSFGFRQRVGIGQAVIHDPALVILDEPTGALDPVQIVEMRRLIRSLKDRHTVLLSSHNLPEISQTCDRLMVIRDGELVAAGREGELSGRMAAVHRIRVELGPDEDPTSVLEALTESGLLASYARDDVEPGYRVELTRDEPEGLNRALVEAGLSVRRLQPVAGELESLFIQLTGTAP